MSYYPPMIGGTSQGTNYYPGYGAWDYHGGHGEEHRAEMEGIAM